MEQWYLLRQNQTYGPYPVQQLLDWAAAGQLLPEDRFARAGSQVWLDPHTAMRHWQAQTSPPAWTPAPGYQPAQGQPQVPVTQKKRKKHGCLIAFLVVLLGIGGLIAWRVMTRTSDNLSLGKRRVLMSETVSPNGGVLSVSDPSGKLNGLTLSVPEGSKSQRYTIATREIKAHRFGPDVKPVTPLINIDNGHGFANKPMLLTIPVSVAPDKFVMGFFYDEKSGKLEGIPFTELSDQSITLITHHFSDLFLAETSQERLKEIKVDSGFRPGVDDWQFVNRGSWIAPGGHCAGQTISMVWYFTERYRGNGERRLYGRYDNNDYGYGTIDFWRDDSLAYRFASVIQNRIDWDSRSRDWINKNINTSAVNTYCAFAFSLLMTGEPQYLSIRGDYKNPASGATTNVGHAIAVYRIEAGTLYVADPNYPGTEQRTVRFDDKSFKPYNSGLNAEAIAESGEISFNQMFYMAKTALIDYSTVAAEYAKIKNRTIGTGPDEFVATKFERLVKIDPTTKHETWEPCPTDLKLSAADTAKVDPSLAGKIKIRITNPYSNMVCQAFMGLNPTEPATDKELAGSDGTVSYTITLSKGVSHFGFSVDFRTDTNQDKYSDFIRLRIQYEQNAFMEFPDQPYQAIADLKFSFAADVKDAPSGVVYRWDFGDSSEPLETKRPKAEHIFTTPGSQTVRLYMVSPKDETVLAECEAAVDVLSLYGGWNLNYTIEEAGSIDSILNLIVNALARFFALIFDLQPEGDFNVTITGTTISCIMSVNQPLKEGEALSIQLQQQTSSTDWVNPSTDVWEGRMTVDGDLVKISITAEGQPVGFTFTGTLTHAGLAGTFNAGAMSGSFTAAPQ